MAVIERLAICCLLALCLCSCRGPRHAGIDPDNTITTDWIATNGIAMQVTFFPAILSVSKGDNLYARVTVRNDSARPLAIPKGNAGSDFGSFEIDNSLKRSAILMREWTGEGMPGKSRPGNYCVVAPGQTVSTTGLIGIVRRPDKGNDPRPVLLLRAGAFHAYRVRTGIFAAYFTRRGADRFFLTAKDGETGNVKNMEEAVGAPAWTGQIGTPSVRFGIVR